MTFSKPVNGILRANFDRAWTDNFGSLIDVAGEPTIQHYYDADDSIAEEDAAFINVPHIHLGRDKYSSKNIELRSVYDFTWKASMLLGHVALDVVDRHLVRSKELPKRAQLCAEIIKDYQALKLQRSTNRSSMVSMKLKQV